MLVNCFKPLEIMAIISRDLIFSGWIWAIGLSVLVSPAIAQATSSGTFKSTSGELISSWTFDAEDGRHSFDEIKQKKDSIYGSFEYVPGVSGNAIKLDGFRTFIKRDRYDLSNLKSAFTVEAWIALASYPWSWAPVIDCSFERLKGFFFGIGPEGNVGFMTGAGNTWHELITDMSIP